jgi:hypothetical protein
MPDGGGRQIIEPGTLDGLALYEMSYLDHSTIPNREPSDVPMGAKRVEGPITHEKPEYITLGIDIVE